jgi:mannose-6-phosphate isomerase-like protein (cupin superfamily)
MRHVIHESEVEAKPLPGRMHKMIISPWHFGGAKTMCFGVADFPPNAHAPGHIHAAEEEMIYVLTGHGEMYFDGVPEPIEPGSCVYVPANCAHSINNTSDEVLKIVYVFSPPVKQGSYDRPSTE